MVSALLNPSMLAELEKIRGIGIGIQDIGSGRNPPAIIVLYPGQERRPEGSAADGHGRPRPVRPTRSKA